MAARQLCHTVSVGRLSSRVLTHCTPRSGVILVLSELLFDDTVAHNDHGVQSKLEEIEQDLVVINENSERLKKNQAELSELQLVLEKAGAFFDDARVNAAGYGGEGSVASAVDAPLLDDVPVRSDLLSGIQHMAAVSHSVLSCRKP